MPLPQYNILSKYSNLFKICTHLRSLNVRHYGTDEVTGLNSIVTYSGVLFAMELYCTPKVNTLQLNTVSNSSNTRTRPTCTVPEHSFL
jgi:hypothetical protein